MLNTNIYIRVKINNEWKSVDIGDPALDTEQLLRWLASKDNDFVVRTIMIIRATIRKDDKDAEV